MTAHRDLPFRLVCLGELSLHRADTPTKVALPKKALAMLAVLAAAGGRAVSRDRIAALLWPEAGGPGSTGRGALKQTVYELRQALGTSDVIMGTTELTLDASLVGSDVAELEGAHEAKDFARAADCYRGPFLDGFALRDAPEFDHWVDAQRGRCARLFREAIEALAATAATRGDARERVAHWRRLALHDPLDARVAVALIEALAAAGDRAGALTHFQIHERLLREQLDVTPEPAVVAAAERVRAAAVSVAAREPDRPAPISPTAPDIQPATPPLGRPRRLVIAVAALTVPIAVLAATMLAREPARVIASLAIPPTDAMRLVVQPELRRLFLDPGARFDGQLLELAYDSDSFTTIGAGSGVTVDPTTHWVWSGDYTNRTVIARNGRTHAEIGRVPVPGCPHSFAMSAEWVWVGQQCDDHISVIDRRDRRAVRHIPVPTLSRAEVGGAKGMGEIFVNRATGIAYFAKDNIPHRLDPATWEMRETPDFEGQVIGVNDITNRLYVKVDHGVRVIDGATERLIAELPLAGTPGRAAVGLAGSRVYLPTRAGIAVLDGRTDRLLLETMVGDSRGFRPDAIAVDAAAGRVYVAGTERDGSRALKIVVLDR